MNYDVGVFTRRRIISPAESYFAVPPAGVTWTPASVTTDFWYDADDAATITASSGAVSQWNDKSGNARHATQASSGLRLTDTASVQNSKHGLLSTIASTTYMDIPAFTRAQPFILACAVKQTTGPGNNTTYTVAWDATNSGAGTRPIFITRFGDGTVSDTAIGVDSGGAVARGGGALADNTAYYFICLFNNGGTSVLRKNGSTIATNTLGTTGISNATTQQLLSFYTPFPGYVLEMFLIPGNSVTDYTNAETYLAAKWAI